MDLKEIEKYFEEYSFYGPYPVVSKMKWLIQRVKELEAEKVIYEKHQEAAGIILNKAHARIESLEASLKRFESEHFEAVNRLVGYTSEDSLPDAIGKMAYKIKWLEAELDRETTYKEAMEEAVSRVKELETDLTLNKSILARQCDLAREAETKEMEANRRNRELLNLVNEFLKKSGAELARMKLEKIPLVEVEK